MKMKNLFCLFALVFSGLFMASCSDDVVDDRMYGPDDTTNGIEYEFESGWGQVHEKVIDISGQPDDFVLMFRATALYDVEISKENEGVKAVILDPIVTDEKTGEILNEPVFSDKPYRYMQRVRFETNGEKQIGVTFNFNAAIGRGRCSATLVRK